MTTPTTSTAADITAGTWVRFPDWEQWRYIVATRHVHFSPDEPRSTGLIHLDCSDWPSDRYNFGGFAIHQEPCRIVTVTPQAVTA